MAKGAGGGNRHPRGAARHPMAAAGHSMATGGHPMATGGGSCHQFWDHTCDTGISRRGPKIGATRRSCRSLDQETYP